MHLDEHDQAQQGPSLDELRLAMERGHSMPVEDPAHAPGKRRIGRPADSATPHQVRLQQGRHQPWVPTSGLVGRTRRSARRS